MPTVIDASNAVAGRLASVVAKRLLNGESIVVLNAERAVVTGTPDRIRAEHAAKRRLGKHQARRKGPFPPRRPERILRRTVRGMLPYQQPRGREALRRLRVYAGIPPEWAEATLERLPEAEAGAPRRYLTLAELSRGLGATEARP